MRRKTRDDRSAGLPPTHRSRRHNRNAFSIAELSIVVAIIGIISAIAIPRFSNSLARQNIDAAARRIAADFDFARRIAMQRSTPQIVRLAADSTAYSLIGVPHLNHPTQVYRVSFADDCNGVRLTSYDFGGDLELIFDMYGVPDTGGQFVIRAGASQRTIAVDASTGQTRVTP